MGPKQLFCFVTVYLMQLFTAELIIQKTGLFKFGECWSPIFTQNERTRGQQIGSCAFLHKGLKPGKTDCLQVKEAGISTVRWLTWNLSSHSWVFLTHNNFFPTCPSLSHSNWNSVGLPLTVCFPCHPFWQKLPSHFPHTPPGKPFLKVELML